jgi:hypothetical protein
MNTQILEAMATRWETSTPAHNDREYGLLANCAAELREAIATTPAPAATDGDDLRAIHIALRSVPITGQDAIWHAAQEAMTRLRAALSKPRQSEADSFREGVARQWLESKDADICKLPPDGWHCRRGAGHDGPCASAPNEDLRSCTICGLTVDVSKGHVAPSSGFTMQGRTKSKDAPPTAIPDGMVVVPREPTPEMLRAMAEATLNTSGSDTEMHRRYNAMIAAAPGSAEGDRG